MKKILIMTIVISLFVPLSFSAAAGTEPKDKLSDYTDDACIAFLKDNGVTIPNIYYQEAECIPLVRTVIEQVE